MEYVRLMRIMIILQVPLVIAHIHRNTRRVKASLSIQRSYTIHQALLRKRQELDQQRYALQDQSVIQEYAQKHLGMKELLLTQVKKLARHES